MKDGTLVKLMDRLGDLFIGASVGSARAAMKLKGLVAVERLNDRILPPPKSLGEAVTHIRTLAMMSPELHERHARRFREVETKARAEAAEEIVKGILAALGAENRETD